MTSILVSIYVIALSHPNCLNMFSSLFCKIIYHIVSKELKWTVESYWKSWEEKFVQCIDRYIFKGDLKSSRNPSLLSESLPQG